MGADLNFMHSISESLAPKVASFGFIDREATGVLLISPDGAPDKVARAVWTAPHDSPRKPIPTSIGRGDRISARTVSALLGKPAVTPAGASPF